MGSEEGDVVELRNVVVVVKLEAGMRCVTRPEGPVRPLEQASGGL